MIEHGSAAPRDYRVRVKDLKQTADMSKRVTVLFRL